MTEPKPSPAWQGLRPTGKTLDRQWQLFRLVRAWLETTGRVPDEVLQEYQRSLGGPQ